MMADTAFGPFGVPAEEMDKHKKVLDGLKNKSSSPNGAASQEGALGAPASAGDSSPAFDKEVGKGEGGTGMTMVNIFMDASDEEKDELTKSITEGLAPHGKSLEGGFLDALKKGGPQAMAKAAQFGVDLEPWAEKLNPTQSGVALGQAMGNIPSDEQAAGKEAFKSTGKALADNKAATKKTASDAATKKREQRAAMSAFLMETGLRILASQRSDAGEAFGEAALGTMDSNARKKRLAANDKMQAAELERQHGREDTKDTMAKQKRAEEAAGAERDKLEKITTENGNVEFVKIKEGRATGQDGKPVIVDDYSQLSATARRGATDAAASASTRYRGVLRDAMESSFEAKAAGVDVKKLYDMPAGPEKDKAINDWIKAKVKADGYFAAQDPEVEITNYSEKDW